MLQKTLNKQDFNCGTDYALETINSINFDRLIDFFGNLSADPYIKENYRFRHLSRFQVTDDEIVKLPHDCLFQSKKHNPLLGNEN